MPPARCLIVAAALLALTPAEPAAEPLPYGAQIVQIADADELRFQVGVYTLEHAVDPPYQYKVVRTDTAPGMVGSTDFTVWLPFPPEGETYDGTYFDPAIQGLDAGQYQVIARWSDDRLEILDSEWFALVEHPYVLRGVLVSPTVLEPCLGGGLLECIEVELMDPQWWDLHGTVTLLDIYGWPVRLDDRDDCAVRVTWVEPMPDGSECGDPMATSDSSWTTVRALYR